MTTTRLLSFLKVMLYLLMLIAMQSQAQIWTVLAFDAKGDGRDAASPDIAVLSYRYEKEKDLLWFRVSLYGKPNQDAVGVSIAVDTGADNVAKVNWWGANKDFKFDKLVSACVVRRNGSFEGPAGVGDAAGVTAGNYTNLLQNNVQIRVEGDSILLGIKRADFTEHMKMNLIAGLGCKQQWEDDTSKRISTIDLAAPRPKRNLREIDLARNNFQLPSEQKTLADREFPQVVQRGRGPIPVVIIPGVYSPPDAFDNFMQRHESAYKFVVITPPGLNGTPARPLPPESTSYGEMTWTRRLEDDVYKVIRSKKLKKPIIIAHGFPGSLVAHGLATRHPESIRCIVDIGTTPVQFFPSPKDPTGKTAGTPAERVLYVDEIWAKKWFKFVTPETWESNNYPAAMFSNDPERAERARKQIESASLPVKIRYTAEFFAADQTADLVAPKVPILALIPGFNEQLLSEPGNSGFKTMFQDSWKGFSGKPGIRLLTIPDGRALLMDDQPKLVDEAIANLVHTANSGQATAP